MSQAHRICPGVINGAREMLN
uniref:Uncharacterized protein n=1 Tax=Anguilla anguilla TaxID=7936 RepID=A0A0E9R878_ANGAN